MENKLSKARLFATLMILLIGLGSVTCETDSAAHQRGYSEGYKQGYQEGRAGVDSERTQSYQDGFNAGFEAARPSSGTTPPAGVFRKLSSIVMILGMVKIVFSLIFFIVILMLDSALWTDRVAKILATSLAALVVFWVSHISSVGLSERLSDLVLKPAVTSVVGKILVGVIAGTLAWLSLWLLERMVQESEGEAKIQTLLVFGASALLAVLIPFFVSLWSAPNITSYRFFDLIFGIVLGGMFWLVQRLLAESSNWPSILKRSAYYRRVLGEEGSQVGRKGSDSRNSP